MWGGGQTGLIGGDVAARVEHHAADTTSQAAASVRGELRSGF
jgi:hypothetical protein